MNKSSFSVSQNQYSLEKSGEFLEIIISHAVSGETRTTHLDLIGGFRVMPKRDNSLPYPGTAEVTSNGKAIVKIRFYGDERLLAQVQGDTLDEKVNYAKSIIEAY